MHECHACNAFYHMSCHNTATILSQSLLQVSASTEAAATLAMFERDQYCPDCLRRRKPKVPAPGASDVVTSAQRRGK